MDFTSLHWQEIINFLGETLVYLPGEVTETRPYDIDRFTMYRVRIIKDEAAENTELWRTYSYPNPFLCAANGRANIPRHPVFYCSDHPGAAMAEARPSVGDVAYLGAWLIRCHRPTRQAAIFPESIPDSNAWRQIARNRRTAKARFLNDNFEPKVYKRISAIDTFFDNEYRHGKAPYHITSALSHMLLYEPRYASDDLIYPSAQTKYHACNLAFNPNFVDEFMKLDKIYRLLVVSTDDYKAGVAVTAVGDYNGHMFDWGPPH